MPVLGDTEEHHLDDSLAEEKQPELAVVEFSNTAADPEAVMIELADTLVAVVAVARPIRHDHVADVAETFLRRNPRGDMSDR